MTQINLPNQLINEVKDIMDSLPVYKNFGLYHRSDYVKEALKEFVKCNGQPFRKAFSEEVDRIIAEIIQSNVGNKQ